MCLIGSSRKIFFRKPKHTCRYYQPAGPLISPHVLPPPPPPAGTVTASNTSTVDKKSNIVPIPLDSDPEQHSTTLQTASQPTTERADSADSDVLITGGDLTAFRHSSSTATSVPSTGSQQTHHHDPPPPTQPVHHSAVASTATTGSVVAQSSPYSRSMHQMHYPPAYPHNYYTPYPGDAMCYSPPYQSYFPTKVYQTPVAINAIAAMNDTSSKPSLVEMNKVPVKEIKQENQIKKELTEEDDVVIVEDVNKKEPEIKTEPEVVEISSNGSTPPLEVITTDLSQDSSDVEITSYSPPQSGKRIGILYSNLNPKAIIPTTIESDGRRR
uniref:Uncharacterized protein n=1 Tax=Megaselia scalaris TaxID=36166 RepID=T1GTH9_MEGSC